jgi:hypothetical protein
MNTALDLTLELLGSTPNAAADQLLALAIAEDTSIRRHGISALLKRRTRSGALHVLRMWDDLTDDEMRAVQEYPSAMQPVVEDALRGQLGSKEWLAALDILRILSLGSLLPFLIELLESSTDQRMQKRMLATVLELGSTLGDAARSGRDQPSVRQPIAIRLAESVRSLHRHRCEGLCDAFLAVSAWGDRELRVLLQEDVELSRRLTDSLQHSRLPAVMQLVAGYIRRRNIPEVVRHAIERRSDDGFRECLFGFVGTEPTRLTMKNVSSLRPLECLKDWQQLASRTSPARHSGLLYVHTANSIDPHAQLSVILDVIARGSENIELAVISSLSRCLEISEEDWLDAAIVVTETEMRTVNQTPLAQLLWRILQLLDHPDHAVVEALRHVLRPLHVDCFLRNIDSIPLTNFRRLGGMMRKIDPRIVEVLSDEMRCPVMERRLRAIKVAKACDVVDAVESLLAHAAIHDHRETRLVAIDTLAFGASAESLDALRQIAEGPVGALRDAAIRSLELRGDDGRVSEVINSAAHDASKRPSGIGSP